MCATIPSGVGHHCFNECMAKYTLIPSAGFDVFEKITCIFSIAPMGSLEKSREYFSLRNTHRTQVLAAPDAASARPVRCLTLARVSRAHRTRTEHCSLVRWCLTPGSVSDWRAPDAQGASGGSRSVTLRVCGALYTRVRCAPDASSVEQQSVRCGWCKRARALAVGSNGRVQTASDTWLFLEHRTHCSGWLPAVSPVPPTFVQWRGNS